MYGWRARLAIIVPSGIIAIEPDLNRMTPAGVSCHCHRVAFAGGLENLKKIEHGIADATKILTDVHPSAMALAGTGASFANGYGYDQKIIAKMKEVNDNIPSTTTSTAVIEALRQMGIKKVSVAMPYLEEVAKVAIGFIRDHNIEVIDSKWLNLVRFAIAEVSKETLYQLVKAVNHEDSQAVLISCINLHAIDIIEALERDLQKPIITSNQATMWHLLRIAGINDKVEGFGRLLSRY